MKVSIIEKTDRRKIEEFIRDNEHIINKFYFSTVSADDLIENEVNFYSNGDEKILKYIFYDEELKIIYSLEKLEWDQHIFNRNMWKLNILVNSKLSSELISNFKDDLNKECDVYKIDHISCQVKARDYNKTYVLEQCGFRIVDSIIRFGMDFSINKNLENYDNTFVIRKYRDSDYNEVIKVGKEAFTNYPNRFLNEGTFLRKHCDEMYEEWLVNSTKGFADLLLVAQLDDNILGFSTLKNKKIVSDKEYLIAERQISGVSKASRGLGLNTKMLNEQLIIASKYADYFEVGTQIYNYTSQKTYYKCGLKPIDAYYSFHISL
jgi:hypothetical protein